MATGDTGIERIRAAQRRRWDALGPDERRAQTARARYAADTRWERQADPDGRLDPVARAIAGAQLRDAHYAALGVTA